MGWRQQEGSYTADEPGVRENVLGNPKGTERIPFSLEHSPHSEAEADAAEGPFHPPARAIVDLAFIGVEREQ
ncbi:hypothetical protein MRX96_007879 [Rhipicephalus microplus]